MDVDVEVDQYAHEIDFNQMDAQTAEDSICQQNNIKHKNKNINRNDYFKKTN